MSQEHHLVNVIVPVTFEYHYRVGSFMERYLDELADKKIVGVECPKCGRVLVPPRSVCGSCFTRPEKWVEVGPQGELRNYTVAHVEIVDGEIKDSEEPRIIGMVKLDGADSLVCGVVEGVSEEDLKTGLRLKAVFVDEPKGSVKDLDHFEPVG